MAYGSLLAGRILAPCCDWRAGLRRNGLLRCLCRLPLRLCLMQLALLFCLAPAHAAPPCQRPDVSQLSSQPLHMTPCLSILEDSSARLTLHEVHDQMPAGRFRDDIRRRGHFGISSSAWWLRLELRNNSAQTQQMMLELRYANLGLVSLYEGESTAGAEQFNSVHTGNTLPFTSRAWPNHHFIFPLKIAAHSEHTLYLRIAGADTLETPLWLWREAEFLQAEQQDYQWQGWYFGMQSALILYTLLLYLTLRDADFLWYAAAICAFTLSLAGLNGIGNQYLWPNAGPAAQGLTLMFGAITTAIQGQFMRRILNTRENMPLADRIIRFLIWLQPVWLPLIWFAFAASLPFILLNHVVCACAVLGVSIYACRLGQKNARYFVFSYALVAAAVVLTTLRSFNFLPSNFFTTHALQASTAILALANAYALIARFNGLMAAKAQAQKEALAAQEELVRNLRDAEREQEARVQQRTNELLASHSALSNTNSQLNAAYESAESSRQQAEKARQIATRSLNELRAAQKQVVQSEKLAALGQLIAGVAHEINTPIGAVKASGKNIADALEDVMHKFPPMMRILEAHNLNLFLHLLRGERGPLLSTREERSRVRQLSQELEQAGISDARRKAGILAQLDPNLRVQEILPLLQHPDSELILTVANHLATIINSTSNINSAVERVTKIIFALRTFSSGEKQGEWSSMHLKDGIETVLMIYQSQIKQGVELVREYENIPPLYCIPDQLNQVWTNLIHNALQAMQNHGVLCIRIAQEGAEALVEISDSGCGMSQAVIERIFEPFFTTKAPGEGSGLGLDIVSRIIKRHRGRIQVQSEPDVGSTFFVYLPYLQQIPEDDEEHPS
ncbi:7TM diverse intracellular signaling domain-containing protein [Massilia sp. W12]|uniref:sensor histidine kinase n=1 Tax=Massilia sp. W12 TaxID=3126507 RepID=UPI0030CF35F8